MIGTGPFKFNSYTPKQSVKLDRFADYWETGKPYVDGWDYTITNDRPAIVNAILSGTVDGGTQIPPNQFDMLSKSKGVVGKATDSKSWYAVMQHITRKPWDDVRVRKAFALGVDRTALLKAVQFELGQVSSSFVLPQWHWAYFDTKSFAATPDVAGAKKLLADAGFANGGIKGSFAVTQAVPSTVQMALLMTDQLKAVGFDLDSKQMELAAWLKAVTQDHDFDLLPYNSTSAGIDPDHLLATAFQTKSPLNLTQYSNPKVDMLLQQGRSTLDQNARKPVYQQLQQTLADDVAHVPLFIPKDLYAVRDYVKDATFLPGFVLYGLRYLWLDK
jgi:peptide/nickel transport system substrate-binding protein